METTEKLLILLDQWIDTIENLLCAKHCAKHFTYTNNTGRKIELSLFYKRVQGSEKLSHLFKVILLVSVRIGIWTLVNPILSHIYLIAKQEIESMLYTVSCEQ